MSGFELLDAMRADERLSGVPVVVYTARDMTRAEQTRARPSRSS